MEAVAYLDTHVVAWLYAGRTALLSDLAKDVIDNNLLLISPMVELELQYLYEIGRVKEPSENVCGTLGVNLGLQVCSTRFELVVHAAMGHNWTRDPFDRLITAHASLKDALLLTKDEGIRKNYHRARWQA